MNLMIHSMKQVTTHASVFVSLTMKDNQKTTRIISTRQLFDAYCSHYFSTSSQLHCLILSIASQRMLGSTEFIRDYQIFSAWVD